MLAQKQAQEREELTDPGVRQVMLRRLSASPPGGLPTEQTKRTNEWAREAQRRHLEGKEEVEDQQEDNDQTWESSDNENGSGMLLNPLQRESLIAAQHDGNVQQQEMEDTTGVVVSDRLDLLVPKGRQRTSIPLSMKEKVTMNIVSPENKKGNEVPKSKSFEIPSSTKQVTQLPPRVLYNEMPQSPRERLLLRVSPCSNCS